MTSIVKIDRQTGEVIPGDPQTGDYVRVTTPSGAVIEQEYTTIEPAPPPVKKWDAYDFKTRFTADERKAIRAAAKVNADVEDFVDMLDTAAATGTRIYANNELVVAALEAMTPSILAEGRKDEILG